MQQHYLVKLIPNRPRGGHDELVVIFFLGGDNEGNRWQPN